MNLEPQIVFDCFAQINQIPRPSKKEEQMIAFLRHFAETNQLDYQVDEVGNVVIRKLASPGYENRKSVILQSHMDMVCEKVHGLDFDFMKDPIQTEVEGEWLRAKGTTLGADDGIGIAMEMAILKSDDIEHGPIECVFTRDEETGLTGAMGMKSGFMSGDYLLNLDSEDEGQIFVSCAGGARTTAIFDIEYDTLPKDYFVFKLQLKGLVGGHSGDDINKKRANANKLIFRFLYRSKEKCDLRLIDVQSGGLHNAIPRDGYVVFAVPSKEKESIVSDFNIYVQEVEEEYHVTEPQIQFSLESYGEKIDRCITSSVSNSLITSVQAVDNGVFAVSQDLETLIETSSNLASIRLVGNEIIIVTSQRSSLSSARENMSATIRATFELAGARVSTNEGYPGWKMNPNSEILKIAEDSYRRLFGKDPIVLAIHAGLECGLFSEKYPNLDMISFGPTLRGVHSPDEKLLIPTVNMVWEHLKDILKNIPIQK